ncbi:four-helix bundle copper-binding protein [Actinoplanes sp. KI2]|uniref:four-helix bundle copper-binding protein n=1 Tax=Actinoplanes sp. KI2 TaxID=2983315 RepID=UPI0021D59D6E|nr:four-helix bundle copper-binding protein [Actinoplanes sp. KI2]MCU7730806.1 four-helix bundle copper-binding protein [Actinoplanes sp. KI2]
MTDVAAILNAHPGERRQMDDDLLVICIQEALNCAQACTSCADACSADGSAAHLAPCTGAALNCADLATAVVRVLSRPTPYDVDVTAAALQALDQACRACYQQCQKHALEIESCQICGEACRRCAQAGQRLLRQR